MYSNIELKISLLGSIIGTDSDNVLRWVCPLENTTHIPTECGRKHCCLFIDLGGWVLRKSNFNGQKFRNRKNEDCCWKTSTPLTPVPWGITDSHRRWGESQVNHSPWTGRSAQKGADSGFEPNLKINCTCDYKINPSSIKSAYIGRLTKTDPTAKQRTKRR